MAKKDSIKRQSLIVNFLRKQPVSFQKIDAYLQQKSVEKDLYLNISQRTFQRDCIEIANLWGIEIEFNKRENIYEIVSDENELFDRVMEAFDIVAILQTSKKIKNAIYLEKRKSKGTEYFSKIADAIQKKQILTFQLNSYWKEPTQRQCIPYAIKEAQNRYYLIAYDLQKKELRNYGLDRISNFTVTSKTQQIPNVDIEAFYKHAFGIECYNEPVKMVLEFENGQKNYIQSLPFHASQKITEENEDTFTLELFMHPTNDFVMEIMRYGAICEVKEPIALRERIQKEVREMFKKYKL